MRRDSLYLGTLLKAVAAHSVPPTVKYFHIFQRYEWSLTTNGMINAKNI